MTVPLNATYLDLSNIGISVVNAYLASLMYAVILIVFRSNFGSLDVGKLWVVTLKYIQDLSVTPVEAKVFQSAIGT